MNEIYINRRILVIDDQEMIHADFRKILSPPTAPSSELDAAREALLGADTEDADAGSSFPEFEVDSALQGQQGLELYKQALEEGRPYAVAFVDMRMPPGWDGLETIRHLWEVSKDLEIVICTAYSDHSWEELLQKLGNSDRLLILKKPFDMIEVLQLANALTQKWTATRQARLTLEDVSRLVDERTKELKTARDDLVELNDRLVVAHRAAEAANHSKDEFLAHVSHEIRAPMTAIRGFLEIILESCPPTPEFGSQQLPEFLTIMFRNSKHLLLLIDDLLDLSKIEAGKLEIERTDCSPFDIIEDIQSLLMLSANEKGLEFNVDFQGRVPKRIHTDPMRLRQILINLVSNSIKFTHEGGVRVNVELFQEESDPWLRIDVKDTGIGIKPDQIEQLFQPFTQADRWVTREFGGTGMGLAVSRGLADLLAGRLSVSSEPGVGSTFRLEIPTGDLQETDFSDDAPVVRTLTVETAKDKTPLNCSILLAEDGKDNQRLITHLLQSASAQVTIVDNGKIAVEKALEAERQGQPFDVIMMDMQMPVMDGYTATRQLREDGCNTPIIALTAHAMTTARNECMAAGCNDYVSKPINRESFMAAIARWSGADNDECSTRETVNSSTLPMNAETQS